jgi:hypothetical protein
MDRYVICPVPPSQTPGSDIKMKNPTRLQGPVEVLVLQLQYLNVLGENESDTRRRHVNDRTAEHA